MLIGIGTDHAAIAGYRPQARATDRARESDESIVGRDVDTRDVAADGAGEVGGEDGGEGGGAIHHAAAGRRTLNSSPARSGSMPDSGTVTTAKVLPTASNSSSV